MLKYRIITALILIPLVLAGIFYLPPIPFACLSAIIILMAAWEWAGLIGWHATQKRGLYLAAMLVFLGILKLLPTGIILIAASLTWLAMLYFVLRYEQFAQLWTHFSWGRVILGLWILGATWVALNFIQQLPSGPYYLLFLLLFIWAADTGAYFAGKKWGKRKLAPHISPGKSIEGVLGGSLLSVLVAVIGGLFFHGGGYVGFILLALITSLISVLGDLSESLIKRQAGVKDSGNLLPGHGGLLDRIDSLLSAAPVFAMLLLFLYPFHLKTLVLYFQVE
jgi:phosphatidate cytidylyltransferase